MSGVRCAAPSVILLATINSLFSFGVFEFPPRARFVFVHITKFMIIMPLLVRFRHVTGGSTKLYEHRSASVKRLKSGAPRARAVGGAQGAASRRVSLI